ncbi:RAI1-domain-containing protein [Cryphonectria parasitica EP155]|uniref:Decapping nuclease n=1 Tax=Cryphonectria parasitica (strain ATCC 38755 / EP155) TaxID=660469 RepID=A0A9P5CUD3_CRYP1|nr:RAI1-domain-containing protein [Cryphonectria parasitica EP155]KAF3771243.1 RAI1-domain-containing protein [Cryphonectria parasitica EP155]
MAHSFSIQPVGRFARPSEAVKRPKEFACFSYDDEHKFHLSDQSLRWYYNPELGVDLSEGFEKFIKHDDSVDEHLDSLLNTIIDHEKQTGKKIDANIIMASPFEDRDGFELNATLYQVLISFIEENHAYRMESQKEQAAQPWRGPIPQEKMAFWGYKFETLATLPAPWGETSREYIEGRVNETVNNEAQYCSVVRTGVGKTILCLGGEVDAIWDSKPRKQGDPTHWVELKTSAEIRNDRDYDNFERKLLKFWIQSFLLGVPKIMVGFRSREGILLKVEEIDVEGIPTTVAQRNRRWDGNTCINFAADFLEWLRTKIDDEGVWRIRRRARGAHIEVFKTQEDTIHGRIITEDFIK